MSVTIVVMQESRRSLAGSGWPLRLRPTPRFEEMRLPESSMAGAQFEPTTFRIRERSQLVSRLRHVSEKPVGLFER